MSTQPPILIAEDDEDDFFFFRRAARVAGIENPILRFRDGAELVAFLENLLGQEKHPHAPLLTFIDLAMPIMNGFDVLEWLRAHAPQRFRSIVLSGSTREEDAKRALALGAEEFLAKPISPMILAALAARRPAKAA